MTMTTSANYSPIDLPMRNHLMVVCGMPYRYAVSVVLCRCGLQCVVDIGRWRREETTTSMTMENDYVDVDNKCI